MAVFSIWEGDVCGIALKLGPEAPPIDDSATCIKVFTAATWNEACQVQYDHYGWGRYKPSDNWEDVDNLDD